MRLSSTNWIDRVLKPELKRFCVQFVGSFPITANTTQARFEQEFEEVMRALGLSFVGTWCTKTGDGGAERAIVRCMIWRREEDVSHELMDVVIESLQARGMHGSFTHHTKQAVRFMNDTQALVALV